jgi:hypothetical protein
MSVFGGGRRVLGSAVVILLAECPHSESPQLRMPIQLDVGDAGGKVDPAARGCSVLLVIADDLFGASLGKLVGLSRRQGRVQQLEAGGADLRILTPGHQPAAPDTKQQLVDRRDRQQHQNQPWQRQCKGDSHGRTLAAPVAATIHTESCSNVAWWAISYAPDQRHVQMSAPRSVRIRPMPDRVKMLDTGGATSLTFYCGELPADAAMSAAGHEPNGYFWEGMVEYLSPELAELLELDSEAGMFAANADRPVLDRLQALIEPYLDDGARVGNTVREAEASGFQFDD